MTNLNRLEYISIRDKIAKAMAVAKYPYNSNGSIINGITMTADEFWEQQGEDFKNQKLIEAQAAMSVMASIGYEQVIAVSFQDYVDEK